MCSLHFKESDYQDNSEDKRRKRRKDRSISDDLLRKILNKDAVPSIMPGLPEYYSSSVPERRSESTSTQARFKREYDAAELAAVDFLTADIITSLEDLENRLKLEKGLPKETLMVRGDDKLTLYSLAENDLGRPFMKYSLVIKEDLQFSMWCREVKLPLSKVAHLCSDKVVKSYLK